MQDWIAKLNLFLLFNDYKLLEDAKRVGAEVAKFLLKKSLQKYRIIQDQLYKSDFDKLIKASKNGTDNKMKGR